MTKMTQFFTDWFNNNYVDDIIIKNEQNIEKNYQFLYHTSSVLCQLFCGNSPFNDRKS